MQPTPEEIAAWRPSVLRFLRSQKLAEDEAQDLTQETMFRALRRLDSFTGDSSKVWSWLFRITARLRADQARFRKKHRCLVSMDEEIPGESQDPDFRGLLVPDPGDSPFEQLRREELVTRVTHAVDDLPESYRQATRFWMDDVPQEEAAHRMGMSRITYRSRAFRGRQRLKELLAPYVLEEA